MIARCVHGLARLIVGLAGFILPASAADWGQAMVDEVDRMARAGEALRFALGCLLCAVREAFGAFAGAPAGADLDGGGERDVPADPAPGAPRPLLVACATAAVLLGLGHMSAGGAPATMMLMNLIALALGLLLISTTAMLRAMLPAPDPRTLSLLLALLLLAATLGGVTVDGATRWIRLGGLSIQPSLILLPLILLCFARSPSPASLLAILVSTVTFALQPDRAMAGALAAGLLGLALLRPGRVTFLALSVATMGFVATLAQPDVQPAMPFVDRILSTAFQVHPMAGVAVVGGALLLVVPGLRALFGPIDGRPLGAVFVATWAAIVGAAALGNYPTPLVGYGGSAILGYLACLWGLPRTAALSGRVPLGGGSSALDEDYHLLSLALKD